MAEKKIPAAKMDSTIPKFSAFGHGIEYPNGENRQEIKLSHNEALISLSNRPHKRN